MVTRRRFLVLMGVGAPAAAATLAGVKLLPSDETSTGFPSIAYGQDTCARCGMVITERPYAAAWRDAAGRQAHFDDIGCMANEAHDQAVTGATFFVHDNNDESWLYASDAHFVVDDDAFATPMGFGVAAFADEASAREAAKDGMVTQWDGLKPALDRKEQPHAGNH